MSVPTSTKAAAPVLYSQAYVQQQQQVLQQQQIQQASQMHSSQIAMHNPQMQMHNPHSPFPGTPSHIPMPGMRPLMPMNSAMHRPIMPVQPVLAPAPELTPAQKKLLEEKAEAEQKKMDAAAQKMMEHAPKATKINISYGNSEVKAEAPASEVVYDQAAAREGFLILLEEKGIKGTDTWKDAMTKVIFDPRYKALKKDKDKREAFEEYKAGASQREERDAKKRKQESKDIIWAVFMDKKIDADTRFKDLDELVGSSEAWKGMDRRVREDIWEEYQEELLAKEKAAAKKVRESFLGMLKGETKINWNSRWKDVEPLIEKRPEYSTLDRKDRQTEFSNYIKALKAAEKERKDAELAVGVEQMNALLDELTGALVFHAKSRWSEAEEFLDGTKDKRYVRALTLGRVSYDDKHRDRLEREAMDKARRLEKKTKKSSRESDASNSESEDRSDSEREAELEKEHEKARIRHAKAFVRDLFEDYCEALDDKVKSDRKAIQAAFQRLGIAITAAETVASLTAKTAEELKDCSKQYVPLLFTELIEEFKYQEVLENEKKNKKRKKKRSRSPSLSLSQPSKSRSRSPKKDKKKHKKKHSRSSSRSKKDKHDAREDSTELRVDMESSENIEKVTTRKRSRSSSSSSERSEKKKKKKKKKHSRKRSRS